MKMIKYVMRNLGNNALRNNKQFDTLDEAVLFAKGSNCWIDEVEVRSDGYFKSTEKVRKVIITNTPEEIFTQSTIVYFDRYEFDLEGYGYRINGEFVEIHKRELPRLKEKLGDDVFNSAMQVGKDYGVDTIIFTEDDFEENANPWTLAYEQFCQESDNKNKEGNKPSITINKIVVVEEYGSAYTIHEGAFLFTPIGEYNQIYYTTNPYEGGNVYDDWSEVDRSIADEHYDYDAILKALDYKEGE